MAPEAKLLPVMVSVCALVLPVIGLGLRFVTAGTGGAVTLRLAAVDAWPLGFVTTMFQVRAVRPVTMDAVICVEVTLLTVRLLAVPPE